MAAPERLRAQGVEPLSFFGAPTDEQSVLAWMPAAAVYFRDPDGPQLEYLAMLDAEARPDLESCPGASGSRARATLHLGAAF